MGSPASMGCLAKRMPMGVFYLIVIAKTDRNSGKCWIGTKVLRLASSREHRTLGDLGMERHRLQLSTLGGTGRGRTELGTSHHQSLTTGDRESSAPTLSLDTKKKEMLPAVPKQGWTGEGADELKLRSCSLSFS